MTIDLLILSLVLLFAVIGAVTGAARQIAQTVAIGAAFFSARPLGNLLGPHTAKALQVPLVFGTVMATLGVFIVVLLALRFALTAIIARILAGKNPDDHRLDRLLGFILGGAKVATLSYVLLSGLAFVDTHVTVAGKKLGISPKDSVAFKLARTYNLFEMTQFGGVKDLVEVARAANDPERARRLRADPAYKELKKDPRFQQALNDASLQHAMLTGDVSALLRNNAVLQLVQDPVMAARLAAAASASQRAMLNGEHEKD